ncbi:MAG: zinc ribbon domain-containing protein [Euryarchaeota archaeon]|nr:zinc ribbon domain-containing protein [Euryarchaeota archaeon]
MPPGLSKCPICATSLQSVIEKRAPAKSGFDDQQIDDYVHKELPKVEMPEAKHACPFCAMELQGGEAKCPRCGIPLISESEMLECPECGALAPQGAKACPSCGVGFEEEPQVPGPPPIEEMPPPPTPERLFPPTKRVEPAPEVVTTVPAGIPASASEGLVNGRGATNGTGLVNGRGAINGTGLVNGRGAVNGTGLVNGTGMTNGTRIEGQLTPGRRGRLQVVRRWQFFAVLVALAIIIPTFIYISYSQETSPVTVDGKFGEWAHIDKYGMYETGGSTQIAVDQWAVKTDGAKLFLYVKTQGDLMASSNVNSLYLFVDSDSSGTTGYRVSGIGADYLLELDGWNGSVQSSSISHYEPQPSTDQYNWSSWVKVGSLISEVSGNQLEAMADLPDAPSLNARFLLFTQDDIGSSVSHPAPETGGLLVVKQEQGSGIDAAGIVAQSASVSILKLNLTCEGQSGTVGSITPMVVGANLGTTFQDISLTIGQARVLDVLVDTSSLASGSSVTAWLTSSSISSTFADVAIVGEPAKAYVAAPPTTIQIDGAFGDWAGRTSADVDSIPVGNENVDMDAVGAVNSTDSSYFYVSVVGQMCGGSYVPMIVTKPSGGGGGGGGIFTPARKTGEDLLRIYIDSDLSQTSGYLMSIPSKTIGADYMVEIKGLDGEIRSTALMSYGSGRWNVVPGAVLDAANDIHQIELGILAAQISGSSSWDYVVETTDWSGIQDLASSVPIGTRGWPVESGLPLQGLDATSYPGQRKIFYDGTNQWSFYFNGANTVYRYSTDGGQTWSLGVRPFVKTSGVRFASIWYDSANSAVYVVGDKSSPGKDIWVINGTVNPATHTITWLSGGEQTLAVSTFNEASKYAYICKDTSGYLWIMSINATTSSGPWNLSVFKSVSQGNVTAWIHSGNMIAGGYANTAVKGSLVPAGTGSQVWAVYTYGGNIASRKYTTSWSSQVLIQTGSGTQNGPMLLAPPSAVVDSRKVVHVVYGNCYENVTAKPHVIYAHNLTASTSFTSGLDLDPTIPQNVGDISPTLSLDSSTGNLFAFWLRTDASDIGRTIMGKKNVSGTWTSQSFASDTTTQKQCLTSIYSSPSETCISWQWTQNATAGAIEVQFETKIPELPSVVMPVIFIVGVFMYVSRRKPSRKA